MNQTMYQSGKNRFARTPILIVILIVSLIFPSNLNAREYAAPEDNFISTGALVLIVGYFGWNVYRSLVKYTPFQVLPEIETALNEIQFIATKNEIKRLKSLHNPAECEVFMQEFWKRRDPTPQTALNELKIQHESRIKFCNDNYSTGLKIGASTDMGRVYILYGSPFNIFRDEIDTSSNAFTKFSPGVYPVEIWMYDFPSVTSGLPTIFSNVNYGGTSFVFMDLQKTGEYTQVYSNKPNEYIDNRVYR